MEKIALIMAAGEGTRMKSATPKTLHEICGVPMLEHVMRAIEPVCKEQAVIVGYGKEKVIAAYKGRVQFVEQKGDGWGTGFAIKCAAPLLEGRHGVALISAGDMPLVLSETFERLVSTVERGEASAAILTMQVDQPFGYGRIVRENGKVSAIVEQKDLTPEQQGIREINSSVYAFDIDALLWALPQLTNDNHAHEYYLTDVISLLHKGGYGVTTVPVIEQAECMGINDRVQLAQADREMRRRINNKHLREGVTMIDPSRVYIQPGVSIGRDTVIHPGCEIGSGCVIGERCVLRAGCQIAFSHVGAGSQIGNSLIKHSTIGSCVRMEHAVVENARVEDGRVIEPFTVIKG